MVEVGVFGSTGYTGIELIQLLARHPEVRLRFATSSTYPGKTLAAVYPRAPQIELIAPEVADPGEVDVVFSCLAHAKAAQVAVQALEAGARIIDLSADFRLRDPAAYREWYGVRHPAPELLAEATYGLPEVFRDRLPDARLVANPGCYPTTVLLALHPLLSADAVAAGAVIVDAKSGVSGAGRVPSLGTHFVEVAENLKPYNIGRVHRHLPEMEQQLGEWSESPPKLIFSPHLLPVPRGLLSTIYVPLRSGWDEGRVRKLFSESYVGEAFLQILPAGEAATLRHALGSNLCVIGITLAEGVLILTVTIDNLLKGASGQALQNMNAMFELDETTGLV